MNYSHHLELRFSFIVSSKLIGHKMLHFTFKFAFVHILFTVSLVNGYIGECLLEKDDHLKLICVGEYRQTSFFDRSEVSECSTGQEFRKDQIAEISFENCSISSIGTPIFEVYKSLTILNASHSGLEMLQKELFREAKNLTKLNVSHNKIMELSSFLFVNAGNLSEADFSFNSIARVDSFAFAGESKMEKLNFAQNKITVLEKQLFDYLPKLEHLNLSHNAITTLGQHTFDNLTHLLTLDLSFNNIDRLDASIFSSLEQLEILNLSNAQLSEIDSKTFSHQTKLTILDLQHNNLKMLDIQVFIDGIFLPRIDSLKQLLIGENQLQELNGFSSTQFPSVKISGIHRNKFECCDMKKLFRAFDWKQLELPFDENSHHPNVTDTKGLKCEFSNDSIPDVDQTSFSWSEMLVVICVVLVIVLSVIVISIIKRLQNFGEFREHMEIMERGSKTNESNLYESPKY